MCTYTEAMLSSPCDEKVVVLVPGDFRKSPVQFVQNSGQSHNTVIQILFCPLPNLGIPSSLPLPVLLPSVQEPPIYSTQFVTLHSDLFPFLSQENSQ